MNRKNLDIILRQYIYNKDKLNVNNDERHIWRTVNCFKKYWDIDADDFQDMFKKAFSYVSQTNLINNARIQPIKGISNLISFNDEVEFVRERFRNLFSEDDGDINARGRRIDEFTTLMNQKILEYMPDSWKLKQHRNSTIYYLNMWRPEDNYLYKARQSRKWAKVLEFPHDIGRGEDFSLRQYYRMCNELLEVLQDYPDILEMNKKRVEKEAKGFDDNCHILVFDIIYCAYNMDFYSECSAGHLPEKERIAWITRNDKIEALEDEIEELEEMLDTLKKRFVEVPDIVGLSVNHGSFGEGTVTEYADGKLAVMFGDFEKKFNDSAVENGFIRFTDSDIQKKVSNVSKYCNLIKETEQKREKLKKKLERI